MGIVYKKDNTRGEHGSSGNQTPREQMDKMEYYRNMDEDTKDIIWGLRSQISDIQHENRTLKLQLEQIKSILNYGG